MNQSSILVNLKEIMSKFEKWVKKLLQIFFRHFPKLIMSLDVINYNKILL